LTGNLFAYRATNPREMKAQEDPVGMLNDVHLISMASRCDLIVAAWGNHGSYRNRSQEVHEMFQDRLHALKVNKSGEPGHPLYLKGFLEPFKYERSNVTSQ
jgi:hypothetical protein